MNTDENQPLGENIKKLTRSSISFRQRTENKLTNLSKPSLIRLASKGRNTNKPSKIQKVKRKSLRAKTQENNQKAIKRRCFMLCC